MGDGLKKAKEQLGKSSTRRKSERVDSFIPPESEWKRWVDHYGKEMSKPWEEENYRAAKKFYSEVRPKSKGSVGRPSAEKQRDVEIRKIQKDIGDERNSKQLQNLYKPVPPEVPEKTRKKYSEQK
jgi:hypothetical protein